MVRRAIYIAGKAVEGSDDRIVFSNDVKLWSSALLAHGFELFVACLLDGSGKRIEQRTGFELLDARHSTIVGRLTRLTSATRTEDELWILVSNHGDRNGAGILTDDGNPPLLSPTQFFDSLKNCKGRVVMLAGQCGAGAFVPPEGFSGVVLAAGQKGEDVGRIIDPAGTHNEFLLLLYLGLFPWNYNLYWTLSASQGEREGEKSWANEAKTLTNPRDLKAAFEFAKTQIPGTRRFRKPGSSETYSGPQTPVLYDPAGIAPKIQV